MSGPFNLVCSLSILGASVLLEELYTELWNTVDGRPACWGSILDGTLTDPADGEAMMLDTIEFDSLLELLWFRWFDITEEFPLELDEYVFIDSGLSLTDPNPNEGFDSVPKSIPNWRSN